MMLGINPIPIRLEINHTILGELITRYFYTNQIVGNTIDFKMNVISNGLDIRLGDMYKVG